jgi:hypothetical protein
MRFVFLLAAGIMVLGCSPRVPLTRGLIMDYGLSSNDITRLQLYVSNGILLEKRIKTVDKNIDSTNYGLKKVEDYYVKQTYFKKKTACIAKTSSGDRLGVAFEQPGDNLGFVIGAGSNNPTYNFQPDKKLIRDSSAVRPTAAGFINWKIIGEETYNDTVYSALIKNEIPYLLVDKTSLKNFTIEARKVKGLRQGDLQEK